MKLQRKKWSSYLPGWYKEFTALTIVLLALVQLAFVLLQTQIAEKADTAVSGILTGTNAFLNPSYLSQASAGLEVGGLIRCVKIWKADQKVLFYESNDSACDKGRGSVDRFLLSGERRLSSVKAANGESWQISFIAQNGKLFFLALWALRALVVFFVGVILSRNEMRLVARRRLEDARVESALGLANLASQVSHDIRSPLAALESALADFAGGSDEQKQLVSAAANRIREIANDLLSKGRVDGLGKDIRATQKHSLWQLLNSIVLEKQAEYRNRPEIEIRCDPFHDNLWISVSSMEFMRVISNLINNSVEAMVQGLIDIRVVSDEGSVSVILSDNGKGMSPETVRRIGSRGASFEKIGSSGLGIFYARERISAWHGALEIQSEVGRGTSVLIRLPRLLVLSSPAEITPDEMVVLVDDDRTIHTLWTISANKAGKTIRCFSSEDELGLYLHGFSKDTEFYIDGFLGEGKVGGEMVAKKLSDLGFRNLFLTTGSHPEKFKNARWIRGVIGKSPPW